LGRRFLDARLADQLEDCVSGARFQLKRCWLQDTSTQSWLGDRWELRERSGIFLDDLSVIPDVSQR
jgi:hypothetical protein